MPGLPTYRACGHIEQGNSSASKSGVNSEA